MDPQIPEPSSPLAWALNSRHSSNKGEYSRTAITVEMETISPPDCPDIQKDTDMLGILSVETLRECTTLQDLSWQEVTLMQVNHLNHQANGKPHTAAKQHGLMLKQAIKGLFHHYQSVWSVRRKCSNNPLDSFCCSRPVTRNISTNDSTQMLCNLYICLLSIHVDKGQPTCRKNSKSVYSLCLVPLYCIQTK